MVDNITEEFKQESIKEILKLKFTDPKTKLTEDAVAAIAEILRLATVEAALRAGIEANKDGSSVVNIEHVEEILPQLILDL